MQEIMLALLVAFNQYVLISKQTFTLQRYFNFLKQINHPVKILCVTALKFEQYVISMILVFFETPCT